MKQPLEHSIWVHIDHWVLRLNFCFFPRLKTIKLLWSWKLSHWSSLESAATLELQNLMNYAILMLKILSFDFIASQMQHLIYQSLSSLAYLRKNRQFNRGNFMLLNILLQNSAVLLLWLCSNSCLVYWSFFIINSWIFICLTSAFRQGL